MKHVERDAAADSNLVTEEQETEAMRTVAQGEEADNDRADGEIESVDPEVDHVRAGKRPSRCDHAGSGEREIGDADVHVVN